MNWTTTPPTEVDHYWTRDRDGKTELISLYRCSGELVAENYEVYGLSAIDREWYGPIQPPAAEPTALDRLITSAGNAISAMRQTQRLYNIPEGHLLITAMHQLDAALRDTEDTLPPPQAIPVIIQRDGFPHIYKGHNQHGPCWVSTDPPPHRFITLKPLRDLLEDLAATTPGVHARIYPFAD